MTGAYGSRRRDVPTASFGTLFNEQDVARADDRSAHAARCGVRTLVRRHARDVPSLLRSVLLRRHLSVCRARRRADAGRARQRHRHAMERRRRADAGLPRPPDCESRRRVHRQRASGPGTPLSRSADAVARRSTAPRSSTRSTCRTRSSSRRWLIVNAGLRYDGYEEFSRVTPRAALIVMPSSKQSFKYLYGTGISGAERVRTEHVLLRRRM